MSINVKVSENTSRQLTDLSKKRKDERSLIRTKQDIVADAIDKLHKKECK